MGTPGHGDFGSAYHPTDHSRPQYLRQGHVPPDGFQAAPLERRWRKALVGTVGPVGPTAVQSSSAGGQDLCPHFAVGGQASGVALVGGGVTSLPRGPTGGHQKKFWRWGQADQQTFFLDSSEHSGPRLPVSPRPGARGPAGGHRPADLAGHLATQEGAERGRSSRNSPTQRAGVTTPWRITSASSSGAHFWRRSPWAWLRALQ